MTVADRLRPKMNGEMAQSNRNECTTEEGNGQWVVAMSSEWHGMHRIHWGIARTPRWKRKSLWLSLVIVNKNATFGFRSLFGSSFGSFLMLRCTFSRTQEFVVSHDCHANKVHNYDNGPICVPRLMVSANPLKVCGSDIWNWQNSNLQSMHYRNEKIKLWIRIKWTQIFLAIMTVIISCVFFFLSLFSFANAIKIVESSSNDRLNMAENSLVLAQSHSIGWRDQKRNAMTIFFSTKRSLPLILIWSLIFFAVAIALLCSLD